MGQCDYFTQTININDIIVPSAKFIPGSDTLYVPNTTENFNNTSANASSYWWNFGDGNGFSTVSNPDYMYQNAGIYTTTLVAESNTACSDTTTHTIYVINTSTGINSQQNSNLSLLNNGADTYMLQFNLADAADVDIHLYNISGQSVYSDRLSHISTHTVGINLSELAPGLYLLKVDMKEKESRTFRLIKN